MDLYCSLFNSPLIKIWSPDCLLPVLGGCDGRWAGLGWAAPLCVIQTLFLHLPCSAVQGADIARLNSYWRSRDPTPPSRSSLPRTALVNMVPRDKSVLQSSPRQECRVQQRGREVPSCGGRIPAAARNKEETSQTRDTAANNKQYGVVFTLHREVSRPLIHGARIRYLYPFKIQTVSRCDNLHPTDG